MARQNSLQHEQLEDAFQVFNQVSDQLVASYHQLQQQVACLTSELAAARSERRLQLAEKESLANRLTRLLETLPAAVVVLDGEGVIRQVNPAATELLPGIALGREWLSIYQCCFHSGQQGGEQRLLSDRLVTLTERSLEPEPGRIILLLDVTETRQFQEHIARKQRLSVMGEMSAQLAHQIRTPLSSALLYTTHLSRNDLTLQQRERFSQRCLERLRHMESQVNDMLAFARGGQFERAPIVVSELFAEFLRSLESVSEEYAVLLTTSFEVNKDARINGNQAALLGAMMNVAVNALQQEGLVRLRITVTREGDNLLFSFTDNGSGVAAENQARIFDPFFTTRPDGTGLGLAVVQAVVLGHQGTLTVESQPGVGACFVIVLPLSPDLPRENAISVGDPEGGHCQSAVRSFA